MKKYIILAMFAFVLAACGSDANPLAPTPDQPYVGLYVYETADEVFSFEFRRDHSCSFNYEWKNADDHEWSTDCRYQSGRQFGMGVMTVRSIVGQEHRNAAANFWFEAHEWRNRAWHRMEFHYQGIDDNDEHRMMRRHGSN